MQIGDVTLVDVSAFRDRMAARDDKQTVRSCAQGFARDLAESFSGVVLARVFLVVPFSRLPEAEQAFARNIVRDDARLVSSTNVLSLVGTYGREPGWRDRARSQGHLAIPLIDKAFVSNIPMVAKLLADLEVDLAGLDEGKPIATRRMMGGRNAAFFVPDASDAVDAQGRYIIPSRGFVEKYAVRTVFGMGGAYVDGTLAVTVVFTDEVIPAATADRFSSLISNFKMASSANLAGGKIY